MTALQLASDYVLQARLNDAPISDVFDHLRNFHDAKTWTVGNLMLPAFCISCHGVRATTKIDEAALLAEWNMNAIMRLKRGG